MEVETSASFLEKECYEKYGKSGKTFYYSQVASTIRWLSTADSTKLTNRLNISPSCCPSATEECIQEPPTTPSPLLNHQSTETPDQQLDNNTASEFCKADSAMETTISPRLPVIPSFSEFVNCKRAKTKLDISHKQSPKQDLEKKMRLK